MITAAVAVMVMMKVPVVKKDRVYVAMPVPVGAMV